MIRLDALSQRTNSISYCSKPVLLERMLPSNTGSRSFNRQANYCRTGAQPVCCTWRAVAGVIVGTVEPEACWIGFAAGVGTA